MTEIRAFVTFPETNAFFAGETLQCKITFKNVSPVGGASRCPSKASSPLGSDHSLGISGPPSRERRSPMLPRKFPVADGIPTPRTPSSHSPGYKPSPSTMSISPMNPPISPVPIGRIGHRHKRSVSIVSLSSELGLENGHVGVGAASQGDTGKKPPLSPIRTRGHGRSASLQIHPMRASNGSVPNSVAIPPSNQSSQPPTPLIVENDINSFTFPARKPITPTAKARNSRSHTVNNFTFPARDMNPQLQRPDNQPKPQNLGVDMNGGHQLHRKMPQTDLRSPAEDQDYEVISPGRVISAHSINSETPRSSEEFYSLANSTTETLISEYDSRVASRLVRPTHNRRHSLLSMGSRSPESLMMGYAQIMGSFTVDGSLIQSDIFEDIKRKGVVGTQMGGGVVGIDTNRGDGGFLSGFGWGGLSGLLGGNNISSIAEMKSIASTKSVPILSTPQSILFVDLRLNPGQSKTYLYTFTLPKGLPPSHKGKAIRISYNIIIGTQRPGKGVQQPKVIEIPFRIFPHVNENGSMNCYDLMSPIVLLKDEAKISSVDEQDAFPQVSDKMKYKQESSSEDFMSYVDNLLAYRDDSKYSASLGIMSPTLENSKRLSIYEDKPVNSKESVELALLGIIGTGLSHSVFNIARNRMSVATVTLGRPAYKLGETITAVIDFSDSQIPCYHVNASLECSETVEPSMALRSASSIHRATRRIHAQHSESTLFAKRIVFTPTIPTSATPEFSTSGVSLSWVLRFEFITTVITYLNSGNTKPNQFSDRLLEQTYGDDRGELYEPRQGILMESFDARIPVKVYPNGSDPGNSGLLGVSPTSGYVV